MDITLCSQRGYEKIYYYVLHITIYFIYLCIRIMLVMNGIIKKSVPAVIRYPVLVIILLLLTSRLFCPDRISAYDPDARAITVLPEPEKHQLILQADSIKPIKALFNDFIIQIQ